MQTRSCLLARWPVLKGLQPSQQSLLHKLSLHIKKWLQQCDVSNNCILISESNPTPAPGFRDLERGSTVV